MTDPRCNNPLVRFLVAALLLSTLLSACGPAGGGDDTGGETPPPRQETAVTGRLDDSKAPSSANPTPATGPEGTAPAGTGGAAGTATAGGVGGPKTTVTFWTWNTGGPKEEMVAAFQKAHPEIRLEVKQPEYTDYLNQLKLGMASGQGPDLIGLQAGSMMAEYGEFLEDLAPYAAEEWGNDWTGRFYEVGIDQLMEGERAPGLPWFVSGAGYMWYNQTIFEQHGLQPPKTFDELVSVSKQLQDKDVRPFLHGAKDAWVNLDMYIALANEIAPGKVYQAEAGEIEWTDPDLVRAMEYWKRLFDEGVIDEGALGTSQYPDVYESFTKGRGGMILMGMWHDPIMTKTGLEAAQKQMGFKEDYIFLPFRFPDVNGDGEPGRLFGGPDVTLGMNKDSKVKDAVWTFISWALSDEGQKFQGSVMNFPSVKGFGLDESDVITEEQRASLQQQVEDLENAIGKREFLYPELDTALGDALQNVATGAQSPQEAMESVQAESEAIERE